MARLDAAVGRYVHLAIDGVEYRVYFEEAGAGISPRSTIRASATSTRRR
jgi:hypothetical protein